MISRIQVAVFAILMLCEANAQDFNCGNDQRFCFWSRTIPSNWITAYTDCTQTGGSLVSSEYSAYIEEWMSSVNISFASGRMWSSLHRINHRFQFLHHQPEFLPIAPSEWVPGHPLLQWFPKRDCVVVNHRMLYESVDCNSTFPFICAISINRKNERNNLELPRRVIRVKLEADQKSFQQRIVTNHLEVDRNETNLMLRCKVTYNGTRKLEYSWIKDGVFLRQYQKVLIPALVHDKSKSVSDGGTHSIYQKQGTYQCQVKEFGAVEVTTSNAIIVTYRRVLNGIVSITVSNITNNSVNIDNIMGNVRDFIHEIVLGNHLKLKDVVTSWDPLYSQHLRSGVIEYRCSLYVDIAIQYPDTTLYHCLDVISEKVGNSSQLRSQLQVENITVQWATYCPREKVTISAPNTSNELFWPPSWPAPVFHPISGKTLCVYENNRAELLTRQCLPEFSQGASLTSLNVKKCARFITEHETRCRHDYQWMESMQLCFKVTESGSWNETMAVCMNEWPLNDTEAINYTTHHSLVKHLQGAKNDQEMWLPVRRSSVYGPFLYYSSVNYAPESITWTAEIETWRGLIDEDECVLLTQNKTAGTTSENKVSSCTQKAIPGVCAYRPSLTVSSYASINLCPSPWNGYVIEQGRLTCFRLVQSEAPMDWKQAYQTCHLENNGTTANVSMATFEHGGKVHAWNVARNSKQFSELKSAWIGLSWSEAKKKFCWENFEIDCLFEDFNWHPSTNWTAGHYGVMEESWNLLPQNSELRYQVLCQAVIYLNVIQNIRVRSDNNDIIRVESSQEMYRTPTPQFFGNLSQFFSQGWRPWITDSLPAVNVGMDMRCYLDGQPIKTISLFPAEFSLRPSFKKANTFNCEGWVGWPRRFVRSEPIIVLRPTNSYIYVMLLDSPQVETEKKNNSINFSPDPLADVSRRLERLGTNGTTVLVTGHRRWSIKNKTQLLVRMVITNISSIPLLSWPEIAKNEFLNQPAEEGYHYEVLYVRASDACQEETSTAFGTSKLFNITWVTSPIGFTRESLNPCEAGDGFPILRKCLGTHNTGAFWEPFTNESLQFHNGTCREATNVLTKLRQLTDDVFTNNTSPSGALVTLAEIAGTRWTDENNDASNNVPTGVEFVEAARLLHASVQRIQQPSVQEFQDVSQTLTAMLTSPNQLELAQSLPGVSNSLVNSLERVMSHVNVPKEQDSVIFHHPKMVTESIRDPWNVVGYGANLGGKDNLDIQNVSQILQNKIESNFAEELVHRDIAIILPMDEIRRREGLSNATSLTLSFSVLSNADIFDARPVTALSNNNASMSLVVDSPIIVAQVGDSVISNLNQSIRIFFRSRSRHNLSVQPVCVFWDKFSSISGGWSSFGCQYVGRSQDLYICECNHLTPLALLFPYFDKEQTMDYGHWLALSLISVIGCIASMVGLSLVILTFLLFRKWRKSLGNKILFNFCLALFCFTGCFLCAGLVKFDSRMCKTTAASMHYFLLACFAWMVVEGIYQYLNYVVIIGAQNYKSRFMRKASPLAWGLPILPVLGIFIYDPNQYAGDDNFCWIKLETFYIAVLTPVSIILLFNIMIFVCILKSVICLRIRSNLRTTQSMTTRSWYEFRMAVCIFFLLGLAWVFGFLSIGDARLVFAYLFCIFNSLQGFAIFVFFVFRERYARTLWFEFSHGFGEHKSISTSKTPQYSDPSDSTSKTSQYNGFSDYELKSASKY
ncbi:uncharacterized protein LOC130692123 [Daphnia carinata]|uniref:uncharacterized protein LOC130692123 n=1 Tax=Daphnia carinata TaxID=120202 RepID=UPI00257E5D81|nr:uncharacterized protein LOC130692123 [Daphnia carinata]